MRVVGRAKRRVLPLQEAGEWFETATATRSLPCSIRQFKYANQSGPPQFTPDLWISNLIGFARLIIAIDRRRTSFVEAGGRYLK
jgi:hypothetical protein